MSETGRYNPQAGPIYGNAVCKKCQRVAPLKMLYWLYPGEYPDKPTREKCFTEAMEGHKCRKCKGLVFTIESPDLW